MTTEIIEGNKLIAPFDGWEYKGNHWKKGDLSLKDLQYHTSWDWLMPVVEKIRSLRDNISDTENGLAYSEISIDITASGYVSDNQKPYRVSLLGKLMYQRMINSYQHTFDEVKCPHIVEYGKSGIETLHKVIVTFLTWYNSLNLKTKQ